MSEEWRPVVGYEDRYEVSSLGRIVSLNFRRSGRSKEMSPSLDSWGYPGVRLSDGGGLKTRRSICVHSVVARAFLGEKPPGLHVNHKDGNKLNNAAENLEYVTCLVNIRHAHDHGLMPHAKFTEKTAAEVRSLKAQGVPVEELARKFSSHEETIRRILRGNTWHLSRKVG